MGGGFDPISALVGLVFTGALGGQSGSGRGAADNSLAQAEAAAAEARQRDARRKQESTLLAEARRSERARLASENAQPESLGAPRVAEAGLKARLGQ